MKRIRELKAIPLTEEEEYKMMNMTSISSEVVDLAEMIKHLQVYPNKPNSMRIGPWETREEADNMKQKYLARATQHNKWGKKMTADNTRRQPVVKTDIVHYEDGWYLKIVRTKE